MTAVNPVGELGVGAVANVEYHEQGHRPGDWMNIEKTVQAGKKTAIVRDVSDGRYEIWHDGHMVFGAAESLSEARQVLSEKLGKDAE